MGLLRFPKDPKLNEEWRKSLGIRNNNIISGTICIEHFKDKDFQKNNRYGVKLNSNAIPSLSSVDDSQDQISCIEENDFVNISLMHSPLQQSVSSVCVHCEQKDLEIKRLDTKHKTGIQNYQKIVEKMESKIRDIKKRMKKVNSKAFYLENTKTKLNRTIDELRKENVLSDEARNTIQVISSKHCNSPLTIATVH